MKRKETKPHWYRKGQSAGSWALAVMLALAAGYVVAMNWMILEASR